MAAGKGSQSSRLQHLTKRFGRMTAVDRVSLSRWKEESW